MTTLKHSSARTVKEYIVITIGLLVFVTGWTVFLLPCNLVTGGVSGISAIVFYATGIKMGYTYFVINALLLLISLKVLGFSFGWKTIYGIFFSSIMLNILPSAIPQQFIDNFSMVNGKLICTILGGVMSGVGIGIAISQGGSTGGTEIIALMINKYRNISPGKLLLWMDVAIILSVLVCPINNSDGIAMSFIEKIAVAVYGFILITVNSYVLDLYLAGSKQSVQVFIFSKKYEEIADCIAFDMSRGVTVLHAQGWYSKADGKVLMVILRKTDLNLLLRNIKAVDPDAFLSVSNVVGVYGQGFDTIKVKGKRISSDV